MTFHNILVNTSTEPSEIDTVAIDAAARIATASGAAITVFDVHSDLSWALQYVAGGWEETIESLTGSKRKRLEQAADVLSARGLSATSKSATGRLSRAIINQVNDDGHDLVLKVAEQSSNRSGIVGSTDMRLIRNCPCAVLILRPDDQAGFQRVAVAADILDQSELQRELDHLALATAQGIGDSDQPISLIYALPPMKSAIRIFPEDTDVVTDEQLTQWDSDLTKAATTKLEALTDEIEREDFQNHVLTGSPATAIPEFVNAHGIDLLIIGSVARKGVEGFSPGNTAEMILERVNCSVLVLKPKTQIEPQTRIEPEFNS